MSTPGFVITDLNYSGEAAGKFIVKAITGADTINGGHVYVQDGIRKQFTIPRWDADYEDLIQARQAIPSPQGEMDVTGQLLTPQDYMIYTRFNPRDFEAHWYAVNQNETLIDRRLPTDVSSVVAQEVLKRHAKYLNKAMWVSNTADATLKPIYRFYDGFIKKAMNAADTNVVSSPTTLTAGNIQGEFKKGYDKIPLALRYDPDMCYFCSYATFDLFAQSQIDQTYKGVDVTQNGVPSYKGKKVVHIADFPDNVYMIGKGLPTMESNLWLGMNSTDDETSLQMQKLQNDSELWFLKLLMKVDVNFGWNNETVLYGTI